MKTSISFSVKNELINTLQRKLWSREKNLQNLVKIVNDRVARENNVFDIIPLNKILNLHLNLKRNLLEGEKFKDYIILNDLVDGKKLLKSIYGGLDFLKSYNLLKNLEWNEQERRWMNLKVFTSKFEPIYPDLIPKDKP